MFIIFQEIIRLELNVYEILDTFQEPSSYYFGHIFSFSKFHELAIIISNF